MSLVASLNNLSNNTTFTLNYNRLNFLLKKFNLTQKEFIELTKIKEKDLQNPVKIQTLKKIDKVFNQGLSFYYRRDDITNTNSSIFLRKNNQFETNLDLYSRKVIDNYEQLSKEIQSLAKNIDYDLSRKLDTYNIRDNPKKVATSIRLKCEEIEHQLKQSKQISKKTLNNEKLNTTKSNNEEVFIKNMITILDELNVIVFEHVDSPNSKQNINFNGCYIQPNCIVVKREKDYPRKQIFTLLHELGHHLLDIEEVEQIEYPIISINKVEQWCNEFAFNFLLFEENLTKTNVEEIYQKTYLSNSALYTHLRKQEIISHKEYEHKLKEIEKNVQTKKELEKQERESQIKSEMNKKGIEITDENIKEFKKQIPYTKPKPKQSRLFQDILMINYENGLIKEFEIERLLPKK